MERRYSSTSPLLLRLFARRIVRFASIFTLVSQNCINEHLARLKNTKGFTESWHICGDTQCLRDTTIEKRNTAYAKAAKLKHIRIHDFRHSHASYLAHCGINIQEIARRLGHAKVEITWNTYSHLYPKEEDRAIEALNLVKIKK